MSDPVTPAAATSASGLFSNLGDQLGGDVLGNVKGLLKNFAANIKATPTPQNVAAQGAILVGSASLQLPNLEHQGISQLADTLSGLIDLIPDTP